MSLTEEMAEDLQRIEQLAERGLKITDNPEDELEEIRDIAAAWR